MEKYEPTPTPEKVVVVEEPIDPADIMTVDTNADGPSININDNGTKTSVNCNKYNRVTVNSDGADVKIKGGCSRLSINGNQNKVTAVGVAEIIVNGGGNTVNYSKYLNGKKPQISDNGHTSTIEKTITTGKK